MSESRTLNRKARRALRKNNKGKTRTKTVWRAAKDLKPGDRIVTKDGRVGTVKAITPSPGLHTVHNFAVEHDHTYFVGDGPGVWVHNTYKARTLAGQKQLSSAEIEEAHALRKTIVQGTEYLSPEEANKLISQRVSEYLYQNGLSEGDIIAGGTFQGAIISEALFNGMNLNALEGTGISLGEAHRLLTDRTYLNGKAYDALVRDHVGHAQQGLREVSRLLNEWENSSASEDAKNRARRELEGYREGYEATLAQADKYTRIKEFYHYDLRDALNVSLPKNLKEMKSIEDVSEWKQMSKGQSILHQNEDGIPDLKFFHTDGREVVYDGVTEEIITDPRFVGTFNYITAKESTWGHTTHDVFPWIDMGNTRNDPTTRWQRQKMLVPKVSIPAGVKTPYEMKLEDGGF